MGVLGLWQLLDPCSRPTKLQGLEGKKLAIDISIWLHQATKGVRNSSNAHLLVLYNRICKLLYFKIKPIFVFDGPNVPNLKKRVLQERQRRRNEAALKGKNIENKLQKNILESAGVRNLLGENIDENELAKQLIKNVSNSNPTRTNEIDDDIFKLPEKANTFQDKLDDEDEIIDLYSTDDSSRDSFDFNAFFRNSDSKNAFFEVNNIDRDVFEHLPPEIQMEYLSNYKTYLKSKKTDHFKDFPEESEDFSTYQMKLLLHKGDISNKISSIKNSIKASYSMDTPFDKVFYEKVASEADSEVVLFTRKSTGRIFNPKDPIGSLQSHRNLDSASELKTEEESINNLEEIQIPSSPTYAIEFNEDNKLKLVPRVTPTSDKEKENTLEEKYLKDPLFNINLNKTPADVNVENLKAENFKLIQSQENINEISDYVTPKSPKVAKVKETESFFSAENEAILTECLEKHDTPIQTKKDDNFAEVELMSESDGDSDDDDFVEVEAEVKTPEIRIEEIENEIIKKMDEKKSEPTKNQNEVEAIDMIDISEEVEPKEVRSDLIAKSTNNTNSQASTSASAPANSNLDADGLEEYDLYLSRERSKLISEKHNADRLARSVEREAVEEAKQLLRLFGLPYVESPGEAEAQCAYLESTKQIDGTITDDSDIWLFGAKNVYKNFFGTEQFIDSYSDLVIKSQLGFDRESLINIALLVGSDYTEGVENVGIVKAVEILQEFEGTGLEKLQNFNLKMKRDWHTQANENTAKKQKNKLRNMLLKLKLPDSFPSEIVFKAYMSPDVDKSTEEFTWSLPDLDSIRKYLVKKMNWTIKKIDDDLLPIIRRMNETKVQKTLDAFISYEVTSANSKQSKRMKNAISKLKNKTQSLDNESQKSSSSSQANNGDFNLSEEELSDKEVSNSKTGTAKTAPKKKTARGLGKKSKSDVLPGTSRNDDVVIIEENEEQQSPKKPIKRKSTDNPKEIAVKSRKRK